MRDVITQVCNERVSSYFVAILKMNEMNLIIDSELIYTLLKALTIKTYSIRILQNSGWAHLIIYR